MEVPIYVLIVATSALVSIGFIIGSYSGRFVTRAEYKESIDRLHNRIDELLEELHKLCINLAETRGIIKNDNP